MLHGSRSKFTRKTCLKTRFLRPEKTTLTPILTTATLSPYVSGPNSVKMATPLEELSAQKVKIDKAYLVSCTNSRASDLAAAAKVFKDAKERGDKSSVANGVKFYIAAASLPEQRAAEDAGDWQAMLDAGAIALPSGCGPCIGLGTGLLEDVSTLSELYYPLPYPLASRVTCFGSRDTYPAFKSCLTTLQAVQKEKC